MHKGAHEDVPDTKRNMRIEDIMFYLHRGRAKTVTTAYDELHGEDEEEWQGDLPRLTMEDNRRLKCYLLWCQKKYKQAAREGTRLDLKYPPEPYRSVQRTWAERNFTLKRLNVDGRIPTSCTFRLTCL